ncbi:MAG: MarR family transcriptional regulator [Myxococcales bacterium]|nr:MarR family transcriptional regulator [Myxococcales bacterium]
MSKRATPRGSVRLGAAPEEAVVLAVFDLANHLQRRGEALAATGGLTTQQWLVLLQIAGDPNFPERAHDDEHRVLASDIARVRGVSRATVSAVIGALRGRGLVEEQADPDDRRKRYLTITSAGAALIEELDPHRRAANRRLFSGFTREERAQLLHLLRRCLAIATPEP